MLRQRLATASVGVPAIILLVFLGGWPYAIAAAVALGVAAAEFQHLKRPWRSNETALCAVFIGGMMLFAHGEGGAATLWLAAAAGLLSLLSSATETLGARETAEREWWAALCLIYVGMLGSAIVLLRGLDQGRDWTFLTLFGTFATDTTAYTVGRAIGRRKLAPKISPKKTWEGFFGGWAGGAAMVLVMNPLLGLDVRAAVIVPLAVLLPLAATTGDLLESWTKRRTGVKDASHLIPGHGGALDRLDSILFTFPLVWLFARWWA